MRKTALRLEQIEAKLTDALRSLEGTSWEQFAVSVDMRDLALMRLQVAGEALNTIYRDDKAFVAAHPEIPWRELRGFRNAIAHDYFNIDARSLWNSCVKIPELQRMIREARQDTEVSHPARNMSGEEIQAVKQAIVESQASKAMKETQLRELDAFLNGLSESED